MDDVFFARQPSLIEQTDDTAVLFSREILEKRYTAGQVKELERLKTAIIMLLPVWPVADIARQLGMSTRTVSALAAAEAQKVAASKNTMVGVLRSSAMRNLALMRGKEDGAKYGELAVALGILMDKAKDLELTGSVAEESFVREERDRAAAVATVQALRRQALGDGGATDSASSGEALNAKGLRECASGNQGADAGGDGAGRAEPGGPGPADQGVGGGSPPVP